MLAPCDIPERQPTDRHCACLDLAIRQDRKEFAKPAVTSQKGGQDFQFDFFSAGNRCLTRLQLSL
jgi:hypothetical protein